MKFFMNKTIATLATIIITGSLISCVKVSALPDNSAAGKYAVNHYNSYNSNYYKQDSDCTNFASQCLYAGGMEFQGTKGKNSDKSDNTKWWYYERSNLWNRLDEWTDSWSKATYLRNNIEKRKHIQAKQYVIGGDDNEAGITAAFKECQKGDVIFLSCETTGWYPSHTIFVGDYQYINGTGVSIVKAYGHTDDSEYCITMKNNSITSITKNGAKQSTNLFFAGYKRLRLEKTSNSSYK